MVSNQIALRITNSLNDVLTVHLEPWGEQYIMAPGKSFTVEAKGPNSDLLELEFGEGRISVYGWSGSVVNISAVD